jgi:predicted O-methyltransferase YrrM
MNPVLREILETHTTATPNGDRIPVTDSIDDAEAELLFQILAEQKPTITLEVGLAAGVSALVICDVLQKTLANRHIIIDPFQNRQPIWGGIGLFNLR